MSAASSDKFTLVGNPGSATTLAAPGHTIAGTSFTVVSTSNWPTTTGAIFAVDTFTTQIVNGVSTAVRTPGSYTEWEGVVASATSITGAVLKYGTDQNYSAGANTRVYIPVASQWVSQLVGGLLVEHDQDGTHGNITGGTAVFSGSITAASFVQSGAPANDGYITGLAAPNTVTALGNRSYSLVFNSVNYSTSLSAGMRLRTTRTVAAPTQCTSLNGTTQYYSKSSPAGMTFTDDFVVSAWVKLSSYSGGNANIASRYNGTSGWAFYINSYGGIELAGWNAGAANFSRVLSYQSVPLNKWIHVTAQLDMSTFTATTTTSYTMIDGLDVPASVSRGGTNPTALIQAGNLEIGSVNGGTLFFPGKIAQVAIYSAKVTQATILASMNQTLAGTETSLISAYSFNNTINDLNANANNLTANGSAVATNADSPFGGQADGTISSALDYAIIQKVAFSTNTTVTVQVPEGCTIPTSGGVSSVVYSSNKAPYGMPMEKIKWIVEAVYRTDITTGAITSTVWTAVTGGSINIPIGSWRYGVRGTTASSTSGAASVRSAWLNLLDSTPTTAIYAYRVVSRILSVATATAAQNYMNAYDEKTLAAATTYSLYATSDAVTATETASLRGTQGEGVLYAEPAYL